MCDERHKILYQNPIDPFYQYAITKMIYSKPDDRSFFDEIFELCFRGHSCLRHKIDLAMATGSKNVIKCSYNKVTKRCEISFNNQLKRSFTSKSYFWVYVHQLIHAYLYLSSSCSHDIDEASDHGNKFDFHINRIRYIFDRIRVFGIQKYNFVYMSYARVMSHYDYCELSLRQRTLGYRQTLQSNINSTATSQKKSLVPTNKNKPVSSSNTAAKVSNKTAPTNVQSTNRKIVTSNPKTPSTSQKKSSVPTNKKNTVNVPNKTAPRNVQSMNKSITTKKPLQVNTNTVSTVVKKSSVPTIENNTVGLSRISDIFPITTTLTNNQGDKIVSIAATKQSTVIVIHND
ncbi:uncharacterized protein LOC106649223 isoform X1 [Trichogramma pretiosum]|uniref:uncharacterized protein LOC106649223 isoform X1 n=2 Tax=Trichogramma pretiosum TaxID=7493 RepID=UPI000C71C990|nr:uncharacterized protein LOC106649223 isoform X1 [Trichogramma pretiosum]